MEGSYIDMMATKEDLKEDARGVTHPTTTALTPLIGGVRAMIITQIKESTAITEKKTTEIAGTGVTLTIQTIANPEITGVIGMMHTEITEVILGDMVGTESMAHTGSMGIIDFKGVRR